MIIPTGSVIFMLVMFALFFLGGIALMYIGWRCHFYVIVTNPWRRWLLAYSDESTLRTVDRILAVVVGATLACFGLLMMALVGVLYYYWG